MQNLFNYLPLAISTFKALFIFDTKKRTIFLRKNKINSKHKPFTFIYKIEGNSILLAIKYHKDVIGRMNEEIHIESPVYIDNIRFGGKEYTLTISKADDKTIYPKLRIEINKS